MAHSSSSIDTSRLNMARRPCLIEISQLRSPIDRKSSKRMSLASELVQNFSALTMSTISSKVNDHDRGNRDKQQRIINGSLKTPSLHNGQRELDPVSSRPLLTRIVPGKADDYQHAASIESSKTTELVLYEMNQRAQSKYSVF